MIDLAIQIVNYKTKAFLDPLISSILKDISSSKLKVEINILDNASGDTLADVADKWKDKNVHIHMSHKNGGFGAGHNILAAQTKAPYLLMLNPDLLLIEEHTIERLMDTLWKTHAAVVGPRLLTPKEQRGSSPGTIPLTQLKQQLWDHNISPRVITPYRIHNDQTEVAWVSGAVFLIDHQQFDAVGGFDEQFFLYFEEVDICHHLRKQNLHIMYDPHIQVLHYGGVVANRRSPHMWKSFLYFHFKRFGSSVK